MLKIIRFILGYLIVSLNFIFRPKHIKRSAEDQNRVDKECEALALYQFYLCPFCVRVRRHMYRLNLSIKTCDAKNNEKYRETLLSEGGKVKVPCLRIESDGVVEWLYESKAIIEYLTRRFY
jgi:glutaredoxin